jgi:hypothetical protein
MAEGDSEIEVVERLIREAEALIERQTELVAKLARDGQSYDLALRMLQDLTSVLCVHRSRLARLRDRKG